MKLAAGKIIPTMEALGSAFDKNPVSASIADTISDVMIGLESGRVKFMAMQKSVMGGRDSVTDKDPDYETVSAEWLKLMDTEIELDITPFNISTLDGMKVELKDLMVLKMSGLVVK